MRYLPTTVALCGLGLLMATPSAAQDEATEFWFNPSMTKALDARTSVEIETAQRLRPSPRDDTYFVRAWLNRDDARDNTWSVGIEQRWNGSDQRETRLLQQVGYGLGPIDLRTRVEQRFVSTDPDTGWRWRQRIGAAIPLSDAEGGWALAGDVEAFVTLKATTPDGQTGLTGIRSFIGVEREIGRYEVSLGYLRQQDIREGRPDRIGHAPFVGFDIAF